MWTLMLALLALAAPVLAYDGELPGWPEALFPQGSQAYVSLRVAEVPGLPMKCIAFWKRAKGVHGPQVAAFGAHKPEDIPTLQEAPEFGGLLPCQVGGAQYADWCGPLEVDGETFWPACAVQVYFIPRTDGRIAVYCDASCHYPGYGTE